MSSDQAHTFRTKTGTCTITPDRIVFAREGVRGKMAAGLVGDSIWRPLLLYGLVGVGGIAFGVWSILRGRYASGIPFCLVGAWFALSVVLSRNNSATPVILRANIQAVEAHLPRSSLIRAYFTVRFLVDGKQRKRLIMMPGGLGEGRAEFRKAEAMMRAAGLISGGQGAHR